MSVSRRLRLPPLNSLKTFHAAMRHRSIRGASAELTVTPQAVSQQIKLLEDSLQLTLFDRRGRSIEPTEAAIVLAKFVDAAFEEIAEGVRRVSRAKYRDQININVSPFFARYFLLPRITRFREEIPDTDLRMTTIVEIPDFDADDIDLAIQWGYGQFGDLETFLLAKDYKIICCSPKLAASIKEPTDLRQQSLLHPILPNSLWADILEYFGVKKERSEGEISLHDADAMRSATLSGAGVGLVSVLDALRDIKAGDLVAPFGTDVLYKLPPERIPGFYLVLPRAHRRIKGVSACCEWIMREIWTDELETSQTGGWKPAEQA